MEKEESLNKKAVEIVELIEQGTSKENVKVSVVNFYEDFEFKGSGLAEKNIFVAKVENEKENSITYELYSEKTGKLIATVDETGKIRFMSEYIESLKQMNEKYFDKLNLEDLTFELPKELGKEDKVFTRGEIEQIKNVQKENEISKGLNGKNKNKTNIGNDEEEQEQEKEESEKDKIERIKKEKTEEKQKEEIAKLKKVPSNNILFVRENSNLYKDHPNIEKNLYFYKDKNGTIKAEYIDENGNSKPSKYFEASSTALRQETVSIGNDGKPVTKEVPYQVMKTKGLNNVDSDIKDIRINIKIDGYGYLDIEEARQGKNGEWLSHDIEVKGRNYNSKAVNETTSIKTRKADPDKQTESYEKAEKNEVAKEDGIEYSEMFLINHAEEIIEGLQNEGYKKEEATEIFDYMIGEEHLRLKEAKEKVNDKIRKNEPMENENTNENGKEELGANDENLKNSDENRKNIDENSELNKIDEEAEEIEQRTMGGDAWDRLQRNYRN